MDSSGSQSMEVGLNSRSRARRAPARSAIVQFIGSSISRPIFSARALSRSKRNWYSSKIVRDLAKSGWFANTRLCRASSAFAQPIAAKMQPRAAQAMVTSNAAKVANCNKVGRFGTSKAIVPTQSSVIPRHSAFACSMPSESEAWKCAPLALMNATTANSLAVAWRSALRRAFLFAIGPNDRARQCPPC